MNRLFLAGWLAWTLAASTHVAPAAGQSDAERHVYPTGGVHNTKNCAPPANCIAKRIPGEPSDPLYPAAWTSQWTMYRVFNKADQFPPPYSSPPAGLSSADYEVSYGASYYDDNYRPADGDGTGTMMEHYDKSCLPIFPIKNNFSCSFISLGNKAYFLRYADRPEGTPACCQFSLMNHAPRRDFIKHLVYDPARSAHLGASLQAYARFMGGPLFGHAFEQEARPDFYDKSAPAYRHPQSFFFSGYPGGPANAPIVSQNYSNFSMKPPDPRTTWEQVAKVCLPRPEWCCLFKGDCPGKTQDAGAAPHYGSSQ